MQSIKFLPLKRLLKFYNISSIISQSRFKSKYKSICSIICSKLLVFLLLSEKMYGYLLPNRGRWNVIKFPDLSYNRNVKSTYFLNICPSHH